MIKLAGLCISAFAFVAAFVPPHDPVNYVFAAFSVVAFVWSWRKL